MFETSYYEFRGFGAHLNMETISLDLYVRLPSQAVLLFSAASNVKIRISLTISIWTVRHEFLLAVGISADGIARSGNALALSEITVKYR